MKNSKAGPKTSGLTGAGALKPDPKLGHDIQAKIGRQLRAIYDDVVNQGVPDRFVELLSRLDDPDGET
jgi:Anti-sigma factor NepR